jgi:hypothetical protein
LNDVGCLSRFGQIAVLSLAVLTLRGQEESEARFGTTVVIPSGLRGDIYFLKEGTDRLPNFDRMEPVGTIYTSALNIPPRNFHEGFPGVTRRSEWFAINYTGRFWIENPGKYGFGLISDDGSKLYIDDKQLLDNDGLHPVGGAGGWVKLAGGIHRIRVSYFQGPCYNFTDPCLALQLVIQRPGEKTSRIFSTEEYKPPANPADWKYGDPSQIPADPDAGRKKLRDVLKEKR